MDKQRRYGIFEIGTDMITDHPEVVRKIMGCCIIVRAENMYTQHAVEYHAICEDFLPVPEGQLVPRYDVEYDTETGEVNWVLPE